MVVLDASFVLLLIQPDARPPNDPSTGKPVDHCQSRIEHLIAQLGEQRTPVIVPSPALAEFLVRAGPAATRYLQQLQDTRAIKVEPFGERAAIECALLIDGSRKKKSAETWAKVKFDRQILAVAKVVAASTLYTNDKKLAALAKQNGVKPVAVHELPLPPVDLQAPLPLEDVDDDSD